MYGNKVAEIVIPSNPKVLAKLEILNLGYNDVRAEGASGLQPAGDPQSL